MFTVLFDGWPLARQPNSPAALHLLHVLGLVPEDGRAIILLPAPAPAWMASIAEREQVEFRIEPAGDTERERLVWEQHRLSRHAARLDVDAVYTAGSGPALFRAKRSFFSPAGYGGRARRTDRPGMAARLREALSEGGLTRAIVLWPADLPAERPEGRLLPVPPAVHPAFRPISTAAAGPPEVEVGGLKLPETFVLYHGPGDLQALKVLLDAWQWAAGSIGDYFPLLAAGLSETDRDRLTKLAEAYGLSETVRSLPALPVEGLAQVYRRSAAVLHPGPPAPWSGPLRLGLASGRPVAALETRLADALAGPAAYLVPQASDSRTMGAALITVVVEESVAGRLESAARERSATWDPAAFEAALWEAIRP